MHSLGVLWSVNKPVEGASEALKMLQNLGKDVYLVTNNSTQTLQKYYNSAQYINLNLDSVGILVFIKY